MKKHVSIIACAFVCIMLLQHRYTHIPKAGNETLKLTTWDAFGYYMYLPSVVIYDDYKELNWLPQKEEQYHLTGGGLYQAGKAKNGNYVYKYLGGVALLESPFFVVAHRLAPYLGYSQDGFSAPYQYAIAIAALFYAFLGIFVLRRVLKEYFDDGIVAITILLLCLATNFIQYVAVDAAMSHVYIFPLYSLVLYTTMRWHQRPSAFIAAATGYIIGLATICRPTEAVMLFIPLLWNTYNKDIAKAKWRMVKANRPHVVAAIVGGVAGILPQLIYWHSASGQWIYDVGSAWDFLTPHLQVLVGWEKGWLIYTPVTIFFIAGLFYLKKYPLRNSVLWFCILNIYIIIAWRDWHYGGSYSTRALVQSYPVFAFALAAFVQHIRTSSWRWLFYIAGCYLIGLNLFQLEQYAKTIIHYRDMNRLYYGAVYLDTDPTPLDMSLLDNDEVLHNESGYNTTVLAQADEETPVKLVEGEKGIICKKTLHTDNAQDTWIKAKCSVKVKDGFWEGYLNIQLQKGDSVKTARARLANPISRNQQWNSYELHMHVPDYFSDGTVTVFLNRDISTFDADIRNAEIILLTE
ncbi:MAG: hypothetical protein H6550_01965 [Chitinophagales bacterium]|nr:hypothetical protein [Chitinophagales bacterium]